MADENKVAQAADMDPEGDAFKQMLAGVQAGKVEKPVAKPAEKTEKTEKVAEKVVETDVKDKADPSSGKTAEKETESDKEIEGDAEETADTLKKQIAGLKAELTKRKGKHEQVEQLSKELDAAKAELKKHEAADPDAKLNAAVAKLSADELTEERIKFQERQADAYADLKIAKRDGDTEAQQHAADRILENRKVLAAIEKGRKELAERQKTAAAGEKDFTEKLTKEVEDIFKDALELHPSLKDENSALFKAGDAEFRKRPVLMQAMGQSMGELVSLAYAILRNPELVSGVKAQDVRKDLTKQLDEKLSKSFVKGGGSQGTKVAPNYSEVAETNMAEFEKIVAKAKGG